MIKFEQKNVNGKLFFYISKYIKLDKKYKKIQVYLGKNIPKNLAEKYTELKNKEIELLADYIQANFILESEISIAEIYLIEQLRINREYELLIQTPKQKEVFWTNFAIQFIFESNAIEGSRLSQDEVKAIIQKKHLKKDLNRQEIQEVENSILAFKLIQSSDFKLNQKNIINLHKLLTQNLSIPFGYKKVKIIVNNKETVYPEEVNLKMKGLINWYNEQKKTKRHPLFVAADFHHKFELIHPFTDGNGRVGRLLFIWILMQSGYDLILFKNSKRQSYFNALSKADEGQHQKWHRYCLEVYKKTMRKFTQ